MRMIYAIRSSSLSATQWGRGWGPSQQRWEGEVASDPDAVSEPKTMTHLTLPAFRGSPPSPPAKRAERAFDPRRSE